MPDYTEKLKLKKPLLNEAADIQVINENMDILDAAMNNSNDIMIILHKKNWLGDTYQIESDQLQPDTSGTLSVACLTDEEYASLKAARISCNYVLDTGSLTLTALGTVPVIDINLKLTIKDNGGFIINLPSDGGDADTLGRKEPAYFASKDDYLALLSRIEAAEQELKNKIPKDASMQFFLPKEGWDENNHQTLPCNKYTQNSKLMIAYMLPSSNVNVCTKSGIQIYSCSGTEITFTCSTVPTSEVVIGTMYQGEEETSYEILDELGIKEVTWYTTEMLPDPSVVLFINAEGENPLNDKSIYNQPIINVNARQYSSSSTYNRNKVIFYNSFDFNVTSNQEMLKLNSISDFDPSQEWQLSFSAVLNSGDYGSNNLTNIAYFKGLDCGFKMSGDRTITLYFYYRDSNGTVKSVNTGIDFYTYGSEWLDCCFLLSYKKVDNVWKYFVEIHRVGHNTSIESEVVTKLEYSDIQENSPTASTELLLGGISNRYMAGSKTYYTYMLLDEIILRNKIDENYVFPIKNGTDSFDINIPTQVEHTATVEVTENTVLFKDEEGYMNKYVVVDSIPQPYVDTDKTMLLLHCDDKTRSDSMLTSSKRVSSVSYSCDISNEIFKLGTGCFSFNGTNQQVYFSLNDGVFNSGAEKNNSLDFWLYLNELPATGSQMALCQLEETVGDTYKVTDLNIKPSGQIYAEYHYVNNQSMYTTARLQAKKWHHVSIGFRKLADTSAYYYSLSVGIDGVTVGFSQDSFNFKKITLGYSRKSNTWLNGYIDEIQMLNYIPETYTPYVDVKGWVRV